MSQLTLVREALTCPICLDFFSDPMTVPCGHTYCTGCIHSHWKHQRNMFTCPECRKVFYRKTAAVKNIVLSGLVERLKGAGPSSGPRCARPHNVPCGECDWRRRLEDVTLCLKVEGRDRVGKVRKRHKGAPSEKWSNRKNKGGDNVQRSQKVSRSRLLQSLQDKQAQLETLLGEAQTISRSAQETLRHTEESFTHVSLLLERRRAQVKEQIHSHQKNQLSRVHGLQEQVQADIAELKNAIAELDPLSSDEEDFSCPPPLSTGDGTVPAAHDAWAQTGERRFYEEVTAAVTQLWLSVRPPLERFSPPEPEPTTRASFLRCACDIALDAATAHPGLSLCAEGREVTLRRPDSAPADHPDRFNHYRQVLSREALSGRCYWEVEWTGLGGVRIALSYKDVKRQGNADACAFGHNGSSWALDTSDDHFSIWFNKQQLHLPAPPSPRVGVYLDHAAGVVSFYSVSQTMSLLLRLHTSFTQPLHVGVWFRWGYSGDTVYFPELRENPFIQLVSQ